MICGCGGTNSSRELEEIEKACYANDYEAAHQILSKLRQNAIDNASKRSYSESRADYLSALETVYTSELTYIVLNFPEDAELRIKVRMNEIQALGERPASDKELSHHKKDFADSPKNATKGYEYNSYKLWAQTYNAICRKLLDLAISVKNQNLAQTAVSMTRENLSFDSSRYRNARYRVQVVYTDRESITSKYEDAVKSGLFN